MLTEGGADEDAGRRRLSPGPAERPQGTATLPTASAWISSLQQREKINLTSPGLWGRVMATGDKAHWGAGVTGG